MKNFKALRNQKGLTQAQCAQELGIPKTTIWYYEQGLTEPSIEKIINIADYFGCSIDYLLGHQTSGILHLDSLTADQRKLIKLVMKMDADTTKYLVGYFSNLTDSPLEDITPRPIKKNISQNWDENF